MAIVNKGVIVGAVRALPGEDNIVGIARVAVGHAAVAVHRGLVGDPQGAVGIAGIDHAGLHIDLPAGIDLRKAGGGHGDRHDACAVRGGVVGDKEAVRGLCPGGHKIGAAFVLEELQQHIALVIGDTRICL